MDCNNQNIKFDGELILVNLKVRNCNFIQNCFWKVEAILKIQFSLLRCCRSASCWKEAKPNTHLEEATLCGRGNRICGMVLQKGVVVRLCYVINSHSHIGRMDQF